MELFFNLNL